MDTGAPGNRPAEFMSVGGLDAATAGVPRTVAVGVARPAVEVDVAQVPLRDSVRWGPVLAGIVTALATLLFLTAIGIALGLSALGGDNNPRNWGTAAGIWGGLTLLVSFFLGGWMAGRTAVAPLESNGVVNGFVTGAATLLLLVWLATTAITGALGFFATTISNVAGAAAPVAMQAVDQGANPAVAPAAQTAVAGASQELQTPVPQQVQQATQQAEEAASQAGPGAWGTAIAILLALGAAALGGSVGQNQRPVIPGTRTVTA
jgi:hypothetical protein